MEATDFATLFLDRELRIQRFTPRVRELFNIRSTDLGRPLADFSQKFEFGLIDEAQRVLDTLEPVEQELQNEEGRWFSVRLRPYRTVDDEIDGVVMTFVEVTKRKEAHRQTEREREYAESIINTVREPLLVLDQELCVHSANDAFYETFEVAPEEATGQHIFDLREGQWDVPELQTLLEEVLTEEEVVSDFEVDQEFEGLGRRVMQLNARRIEEKALILLTFDDVTELKRALWRLREEHNFVETVLDTVGALVVVLDRETRIVRFNEKCEDVTGYSAEEVEGTEFIDLLIPPDEEEGVREVFSNLSEGEVPIQHENDWLTREGERRRIRWSNTVLRDEAGDVKYVIGTGIDVTKRRRLEREVIAAADEERQRIGQDLHDLLASHLSGAALMADNLANALEGDESIEADQLRRVSELVREGSEQARILSHSLMPERIRSHELVEALQNLADRQERMREVACSFEPSGSVPAVSGEIASHLYRIASEAVNNAVKHADADTLTVRLAAEDDHLVLAVRDDGVGIPEDVEATNGVGLHTMRYRTDLIGARLDIEPIEDGGTMVRCRLPLEKVRDAADRGKGG